MKYEPFILVLPFISILNNINKKCRLTFFLNKSFTYDSNGLTQLFLNWNRSTEHEINNESFNLNSVIVVNLVNIIVSHFPVTFHVVLKRNCSSNLNKQNEV